MECRALLAVAVRRKTQRKEEIACCRGLPSSNRAGFVVSVREVYEGGSKQAFSPVEEIFFSQKSFASVFFLIRLYSARHELQLYRYQASVRRRTTRARTRTRRRIRSGERDGEWFYCKEAF